ncbi:MAG: CHAD domain-containing protein [Lysobacterales bacterium]
MYKELRRLTREIQQAARDLRHGYDSARLYELRVAIRRVRSMLKHRSSKRARRLRRTWGGFAAATNWARDWDVFLATSEQLLGPADLEEFRHLIGTSLQSSHDAVTRMLASSRWRAHQKEWKRFLQRARKHDGKHYGAAAAPTAALEAAVARGRVALAMALEVDDDDAWHKFRIAVKEVRYTAEREPQPAGERIAGEPIAGDTAAVVDSCKALQSLLGGWHDCVVQLQLLERLGHSALAEELRATIAERRRRRLLEIRATVAEDCLFSSPRCQPAGTSVSKALFS